MRALTLGLLLILTASASAAAYRTYASLIDLALRQGESNKIGKRTAKNLKQVKEGAPSKILWYDQKVTPDGFEHVFELVMEKEKPRFILSQVSRFDVVDGKKVGKGHELLLDMKGGFIAGWEFEGTAGKLKDTPLKGKKAADLTRQASQFWLKDSTELEWSK